MTNSVSDIPTLGNNGQTASSKLM